MAFKVKQFTVAFAPEEAGRPSLTWALRTNVSLVSPDRLIRFQTPAKSSAGSSLVSSSVLEESSDYGRALNVNLGDWVAFLVPNKGTRVGRVLSFKYLSGKNRTYSLPSVPVAAPARNARGIGVFSSWYTLGEDGDLTLCGENVYLNLEMYRFTLPRPISDDGNLCLSAYACALLG